MTIRISSVQSIVQALENAGCPASVLNPVKEWALDLLLDEKKLTRWMAWCDQNQNVTNHSPKNEPVSIGAGGPETECHERGVL